MRIYLMKPSHFALEYAINPYMENYLSKGVNQRLAWDEWQNYRDLLESLRLLGEVFENPKGTADECFLCDAGEFLDAKTFLPSRFLYPQRQPETGFIRQKMEELDYRIADCPAASFEGQGDCVTDPQGRRWVGHGFRTDSATCQSLRRVMDIHAFLKLRQPWFYHLNMAFFPITPDVVLYVADAFDEEAISCIKSAFKRAYPLTLEEGKTFICNSLLTDEGKIIAPSSSQAVWEKLDVASPFYVDTGEFQKSGGSLRCLSLVNYLA